MKRNIFCFSIIILSVAVCCLAIDKTPEMNVDMEKIKKDNYTMFIKHVVWPSEGLISAKRLDKELAKDDVDEFTGLLKRTIRAKYLPSDVQLKEVIACSELSDGDDYFLLRYSPKDAINISIQEGKALYVMITSRNTPIAPLTEAGKFVKRMVVEFLNLPLTNNVVAQDIHVFVSSQDIGASKCGNFSCGSDEIPPKNWFGGIRWWTDGQSILFVISRISDKGDKNFTTRASAPPNISSLRRFNLKKQ